MLNSVWLETMLFPSASHHHVMDSQLLRKSTRAPVSRAVGRFFLRPRKNPCFHPRREHLNRTPLVTRVQTCQTLLQESAFPLADKRRRAAHRLLHLRIACTVCQQEQHPSDPRVIRSTATARNSFAKLPMFRLSQHNGSPLHERDITTKHLNVTVH